KRISVAVFVKYNRGGAPSLARTRNETRARLSRCIGVQIPLSWNVSVSDSPGLQKTTSRLTGEVRDVQSLSYRVHPDRVARRDRHHCGPHRTAPAGRPESARGRQSPEVQQ